MLLGIAGVGGDVWRGPRDGDAVAGDAGTADRTRPEHGSGLMRVAVDTYCGKALAAATTLAVSKLLIAGMNWLV